jgi:hypothetical protein
MTNLHLTLKGDWVECHATKRACPRKFHVPGMSVDEIKHAPTSFLTQMLEIVDPPTQMREDKKIWLQGGQRHRDHDLPAVVREDGSMEWYTDGERHREDDKPAVVNARGGKRWYQHGRMHRGNDQPAVIHSDGSMEWFQFGQQRRASKGPTKVLADGTQEWRNGERLHRPGGLPAVIHPGGAKLYYVNGKLHRVGGPAVEQAASVPGATDEYYLKGYSVSREEALAAVEND